MANGAGYVQKLGKYNMKRSVVTNRPLNTTLSYYNSHGKYNENIDVLSKKQ